MSFFIKTLLFITIITYIRALPAGDVSASGRVDLGVLGGFNKQFDVSSIIGQKILVPERPRGREVAVLENPDLLQQKDSLYDNAQKVVVDFLQPKPIIDTIQEHEKYGNNGDQFRSIGNAIVGGYEGFSNLLNAATDLPFEIMKQITRKATSYLSALGAKLTGL